MYLSMHPFLSYVFGIYMISLNICLLNPNGGIKDCSNFVLFSNHCLSVKLVMRRQYLMFGFHHYLYIIAVPLQVRDILLFVYTKLNSMFYAVLALKCVPSFQLSVYPQYPLSLARVSPSTVLFSSPSYKPCISIFPG